MNAQAAALETASIQQQCRVLHLPAIAAQCSRIAEQAVRERRTHLGYLEALLQAELEECEQRLEKRKGRSPSTDIGPAPPPQTGGGKTQT